MEGLVQHRVALVGTLKNVEPVLDFLIQENILNGDGEDVATIRGGNTYQQRARSLIDVLRSCSHPDVHEVFCEALRHADYSHLADLLQGKAVISSCSAAKNSHNDRRPCAPADPRLHHHSSVAYPVFSQPEKVLRKLRDALRSDFVETARRTASLDYFSSVRPEGFDNVFVPLVAVTFDDVRSLLSRKKSLTREQLRELASKSWSERQRGTLVTDLTRLLQYGDGKRVSSSLLVGQAGGGKTMTIRKLLLSWAEEEEAIRKKFDFVFYVSGQDHKALNGKTAVDLLHLEAYGFDHDEQRTIGSHLSESSERVLVVLDGADEGGDSWGKSEGVKQLLDRKLLHNCTFVITTRPSMRAYELVPYCEEHFHLSGLDERRLKELVTRRLGETEGQQLVDELQKTERARLQCLVMESPLIANMIAALWKDGEALPETQTALYSIMLLNLLQRFHVKSLDSSVPARATCLDDIPDLDKQRLTDLGELALKGLRRGKLVFNVGTRGEAMEAQSAGIHMARCLGLMEEFRVESVRSDRHEVHFCHPTWQEFLASFYLSVAADFSQLMDSLVADIGLGEETTPFWRFVSGLLKADQLAPLLQGLSSAADRIGESRDKRWVCFMLGCLAEALQHASSSSDEDTNSIRLIKDAACGVLPSKFNELSGCSLSASDIQTLSLVLRQVDCLTGVNFMGCNLSAQNIQALKGSLVHLTYLELFSNPSLHGDGLQELVGVLQSCSKLSFLGLGRCGLDVNDCSTLRCLLTVTKSLQQLNLYKNDLRSRGLRQLLPGFRCVQLQCLSLRRTSLDDRAGPLLAAIIAQNRRLEELLVQENALTSSGVKEILQAAKESSSLKTLDLSRNDVDSKIIDVFEYLLKTKSTSHPVSAPFVPTLTICVHGNKVDKSSLTRLVDWTASSRVRLQCNSVTIQNGQLVQRDYEDDFKLFVQQGAGGDLVLKESGIGDEEATTIAALLHNNKYAVEALDLSWNSVSDDGGVALGDMLRTNNCLSALALTFNDVGLRGCSALCDTLSQVNRTLSVLQLHGNPIFGSLESRCSTQVHQLLASLLAGCPGLRYLSIGATSLRDEECVAMADIITTDGTALVFLNMSDNKVTCHGIEALADALKFDCSIQYLELAQNCVHERGLRALQEAAEAREKLGCPLQQVWMGNNECSGGAFTGSCVVNARLAFRSFAEIIATYLDGPRPV